jgi:hypothetical protein
MSVKVMRKETETSKRNIAQRQQRKHIKALRLGSRSAGVMYVYEGSRSRDLWLWSLPSPSSQNTAASIKSCCGYPNSSCSNTKRKSKIETPQIAIPPCSYHPAKLHRRITSDKTIHLCEYIPYSKPEPSLRRRLGHRTLISFTVSASPARAFHSHPS